jgi:WD40 repeat protein
LLGHTKGAYSVAFSPNGQMLATGSSNSVIKLWDIVTGKCLNTLDGHTNRVVSLAFSPDSQILASGSYDQTLRV